MPALIESEHPSCAHLIAAYKHCSASKSLLSKIFFSECTTLKYQLDACFREEKLVRTQHNIAKGKVCCRSLRGVLALRAAESGLSCAVALPSTCAHTDDQDKCSLRRRVSGCSHAGASRAHSGSQARPRRHLDAQTCIVVVRGRRRMRLAHVSRRVAEHEQR